ncbi:unnamed protein product [Candida verbasci]|uniref:Small-subunit processome Utp12 domain-containing protein n=1 Tax=Candida verbasci TaxID=1227364 RepID=A0A9W4TRE1_9ASCO|nr:unnamed protein product [Candida verbasci]
MKSDFKFSNLLGTIYRKGNLIFTSDGTKLLSPVGNRVSCFDLNKNQSFTFSYQHRKNIQCIALNKQNTLMISIDEDGRAILVNFVSRIVLHHFNFKSKIQTIQFSPCGKFFAIGIGRFIQIWKTPDLTEDRQFSPFIRFRIYSGHFNDILNISWSKDSRFILSTSKDMTARLYSLNSDEKDVGMTFSGHRDYVINAFFNSTQEIIYSVSKDGALFKWEYIEEDEEENKPSSWRITEKNFFYADGKLKCASFRPESNLLIVGFTNGEFRIYELSDGFNLIQSLSMGQNTVNTVEINNSGEWLAFGSSKLGQLLVYEWQSESYILKQQGHFDSLNTLCYSPDGSRLVTGSEDGKIKIWDVISGFCLMTFTEHTSSITQVRFSKKGNVLFSSSLDGTIRAYDLIRFRNFKTFTTTERIQFTCLAIDPSSEILVGGSQDTFEIYVWSVQTGQLLDSLTGHEGPISCLSFGMENSSILASSSWDKTIRIWNIFARNQTVEPIEIQSDVLSLTMRPDCKEIAVSTLDGHIAIFDVEDTKQLHLIDGRKDILQGRYLNDKFVSKNSNRGKHFNTICYSFDGLTLLAGGNNNSICMYDIENEVLIKRFVVSENMSLDGTLQKLNSSKITDSGINSDLIDVQREASDLEDRIDNSIPGSKRGDASLRNTRPEIRVTSLEFSPTNSAFAAATTEGLLIYSINSDLIFDPFDLDVDITPESIIESLNEKEYLVALIMSLRLNETYLIHRILESIPLIDIPLICNDVPIIYVNKILEIIGNLLIKNNSPHIEFYLIWIKNLLINHGTYIMSNKFKFQSSLKLLSRFLNKYAKEIVKMGKRNQYLLEFINANKGLKKENENEDEDEEMEDVEDEEEKEGIIEEEDDDEAGWFGPNSKPSNGIKFVGPDDSDSDDNDDELIDV